MNAVPGATEVTGTRRVGTLLPSQKKFTVGGTAATAGLLELMLITKPSRRENWLFPGTVAKSRSCNNTCCPMTGMVTVGGTQAMVAPIWITTGEAEVYPGAVAPMLGDPTFTAVI